MVGSGPGSTASWPARAPVVRVDGHAGSPPGGRPAVASLVLVLVLAGSCAGTADSSTEPTAFDGSVVAAWNEEVAQNVELHQISPPVAGRLVAYTDLAMHEALATGPDVASYAEVVEGLGEPPEPDGEVHWPTVVGAAAAATASELLVADASAQRIADLLAAQRAEAAASVDDAVLDRSQALGAAVADGVLARAAADGYADAGDATFEPGDGPGDWVPTPPPFAPALEPAWGELEPLVVGTDECALEPPAEFSSEPGSDFYEEAMAVVEAEAALDAEGEEIAAFWNMEPNTGTPAGHWIRIVNTVSEAQELDLVAAAEAGAVVAMAVHDSFITGWKGKYDTDVVRPVTYIQEHIEPGWLPYLVTPPFPEYPSGHSFVSGSAAAAATAVMGEQAFDDESNHDGVVRSFADFDDAAQEAASSRLHGGVHYPMGVDAGMDLGDCIGELAAARLLEVAS